MDAARFDAIKNIDYSRGFSSWNIKWRCRNGKCSDEIRTPINNNSDFMTWSLRKGVGQLTTDNMLPVVFQLFLIGPASRPIPVIYRLSVVTADGKQLLDSSSFRALKVGDIVKVKGVFTREISEKDHILQCWLFIPNAFLNPRSPMNPFHPDPDPGPSCSVCSTLFLSINRQDDDEAFPDVDLVITDRTNKTLRTFHCHRNILATRSTVFKAMLAKRLWSESRKQNNGKRVIRISDISVATMEMTLAFIYKGSIPQLSDIDSAAALINAAEKYNLPELKNHCEQICLWLLKETEPIDMLILADLFNLAHLKTVCLLLLCTNISAIDQYRKEKRIKENLATELLITYEKERILMKNIDMLDR